MSSTRTFRDLSSSDGAVASVETLEPNGCGWNDTPLVLQRASIGITTEDLRLERRPAEGFRLELCGMKEGRAPRRRV